MLAALLNLGFAGSGASSEAPAVEYGRSHAWVVAYLYSLGDATPKNRPVWASRGENVAVRSTVAYDVVVAAEGDPVDRSRKAINLIRFGLGDTIPAHYKVISETEGEFTP